MYLKSSVEGLDIKFSARGHNMHKDLSSSSRIIKKKKKKQLLDTAMQATLCKNKGVRIRVANIPNMQQCCNTFIWSSQLYQS